jgi:hypothetical protein
MASRAITKLQTGERLENLAGIHPSHLRVGDIRKQEICVRAAYTLMGVRSTPKSFHGSAQ